MTRPGSIRPGPACPVHYGVGAEVLVADFVFVAHDCESGADGRHMSTEVFGYFVRHEALSVRMEVRDLDLPAVVAVG